MWRSKVSKAILGGVIGGAVIIGGVAAIAIAQPASHTETSAPKASAEASSPERAHGTPSAAPTTPAPGATRVEAAPPEAPAASTAAVPVQHSAVPVDVAPTPEPPAADNTSFTPEQAQWLAFQQVVRECMAGVGQQYLYWEWWSGVGPSGGMPTDLVGESRAAWELALYGDSPGGSDYRWQDAGCWGYAAELLGTSH
ncbi:hypothetical protein [Glaciibacter flavus]|uniref:hypothetical protein n=1 Tax=Orlajensenia flava TaxID=2565934 RepID=UPI003B0093D2